MTAAVNQDECVAVGYGSLAALNNDAADGAVGIGYQALAALTSGQKNTAVGFEALKLSVDGDDNTAIGYEALETYEGGDAEGFNTAVGSQAMRATTTGTRNVAVGAQALVANLTGNLNTAVGHLALTTDTKGDYNVAIGYNALGAQNFASGTNSFNTAVGVGAGSSNTDGQNNTFIGATAGDTPAGGHNNTIIGQGADCSNNDNQIAVGYVAIAGGTNETIWGNGSNTPNNITADWTVTSDKRIKKDIEDSDIGLSFVNSLRARKFKRKHPSEWDAEILEERYKRGGGNYDDEKDEVIKDEFDEEKVWNGLIAQEVKESMDELGVEFSGWNESSNSKQSIQYSTMVVPLIKAVQELSAKVKALEDAQ